MAGNPIVERNDPVGVSTGSPIAKFTDFEESSPMAT